jgi:hypothetical protein
MGSFSAQYLPINTINQSGLAGAYVSGTTDFDIFTASTATINGGSSFNTWYSPSGTTTGNFDFDLGGLFDIESFALWADPQTAGQGINSFNLLADDNAAFSSPTLLGNYSAVEGLGNANNFAQVFTFAQTSASNVRVQIVSNHGGPLTGFVEGAFEVTAVPEPATGGLILMAGGLLGVLARRRKLV